MPVNRCSLLLSLSSSLFYLINWDFIYISSTYSDSFFSVWISSIAFSQSDKTENSINLTNFSRITNIAGLDVNLWSFCEKQSF
ncbi:unnamed protein product [Brassica napus]|uniref:(rape) hypothetical protein n=1 Tax=Brassica napus TaxID=3708 RepID=A0A816TDC8_BRANA|nr:unnamed protein product [Brassica napus]